ncbi:hypothetical protein F2Q69_00040568 [Brassica cretica]|uniref:Uncharacterized protein n=1 Tax=Brassica cretica TaxID=69181 RepID=A0A8S9NPR4_BRACR|nr:hypothetical protein F2Q69_00040568 [Brassica cretica]
MMRIHETRVHRKNYEPTENIPRTLPTQSVPRYIPTNLVRRNLPTANGRRYIPTTVVRRNYIGSGVISPCSGPNPLSGCNPPPVPANRYNRGCFKFTRCDRDLA